MWPRRRRRSARSEVAGATIAGSKDLFDQELQAATSYLAHGPKLAVYGVLSGRPVRTFQLPKTKVHLFYVIYEELDLVRVVTVWGSRRGDTPVFDDE